MEHRVKPRHCICRGYLSSIVSGKDNILPCKMIIKALE
jgi:hypothetical protein